MPAAWGTIIYSAEGRRNTAVFGNTGNIERKIMNWRKKVTKGLLAVLLSAGLAAATGSAVKASGIYERWLTVAEEERVEEAEDSSMLGAARVSAKAWKKINGVCYNGSGVEIPGAITRGIDVSEWQETIDWSKVKSAGVDFAFVRISHGTGYMDKKYDYNMKQAEAVGIPVGTYVYSTATSTKTALKEAQLAIEKMKGYKVSYPVVYDLEYSKMGELSPTAISRLALAFCNEVRKAGYYPMVYTNTYWYDNKVNWDLLTGLDVWIARYGDTIQAPDHASYNYTIWQSTDGDGGGVLNTTRGLIPGIPADCNVDVDFGYVDYTKKITPRWQPVSSYQPSSTPDISTGGSVNNGKNGWAQEDGKTYYYVNDQKVTGWKKINNKYYYFNSKEGYLYKNALLTSSKLNICYVDEEGARVSNQWVDWKDKRYYMASNGYAVKGFYQIGGKYYYFNSKEAYMYKNRKIISSAGNIYYLGSDGARYCSGFATITENGRKNTYFFAKNGRAYKGWHTINGKKYYFYKGNTQGSGVRAENITLTSSTGVVSVFDSNGVCIRQYKKK